MYNALILEDLLDIYNIINVFDRKILNYDKTIKSLIKKYKKCCYGKYLCHIQMERYHFLMIHVSMFQVIFMTC